MASNTGLIPEEIIKFLNYRVSQEEASSRLYYSMYEWLDNQGYSGAAKMTKSWAGEEMEHAGWSRAFLESYNILPEVNAIPKPTLSFSSLKDVIKKSLEHEIMVSEQCNELVSKVHETNCYHALPLALKYVTEQQDEIAKTTSWLDRLDLIGDDKAGIMLVDQEMGAGY